MVTHTQNLCLCTLLLSTVPLVSTYPIPGSNPTGKRCLAWAYNNNPVDIEQLNFQGPVKSLHNWEAWYPKELKYRLAWRPMIHDFTRFNNPEWKTLEADQKDSIIHFFNEPDRDNPGTPQFSPAEAARLWLTNMVPLRAHGNTLVSPSISSGEHGGVWIDQWMKLVASSPPEYLGLHWYGKSALEMIKYLENFHKTYPAQPIIVSEWASVSRDYHEVLAFTVQMVNWMDSMPWIFEYALTGAQRQVADAYVSPEAALMKPDGNFTDLMIKYMTEQPMRV